MNQQHIVRLYGLNPMDDVNKLIYSLISLYNHAFIHVMDNINFMRWMVFYFIPCLYMTNTKWHDGSWDELEPISILDVIHMCRWDPHTWDIDHKSYTWIDSQPVMRLGISSDKAATFIITMRYCDLSQSSECKTLNRCKGTLDILTNHKLHLMQICLWFKDCSHNSLVIVS